MKQDVAEARRWAAVQQRDELPAVVTRDVLKRHEKR